MKYVIMCGGDYSDRFKKPKQLYVVRGEVLVERTIRLLKENGVTDIAISTNNPMFDYIDVLKLRAKVEYNHDDEERHKNSKKSWLNAYYPLEEACCYIHGDVYFSEEAIKTIVETEVKETMFFCTRDVGDGRPHGINIKGREPLAYKVQNQKVFRNAINELFDLIDKGYFSFDPISWNLYRKINGLPLVYDWFGSDIFKTYGDYVCIDDYTTDVDSIEDIEQIEKMIKIMKGEMKMVKVRVTEEFNYNDFRELKNLVRKDAARTEAGKLFVGDVFECTEKAADYLGGNNDYNRSFVEVLEVIPEKVVEPQPNIETQKKPVVEQKEEPTEEVKPKARKRTTKKK